MVWSAVGSAAYLTGTNIISSGNTSANINDINRITGVIAPPNTNFNGNNTNNATNPGQLGQVQAFGFEVYDVRDHVTDFGYQLGATPGSYVTNYVGSTGTDGPGFATTSAFNTTGLSTGTLSTAGTFSALGNFTWTRTYRFISANILEEVYTVQNNSGATVSNFRGFGGYDPDALTAGTTGNPTSTSSINTLGNFGTGGSYAQANFSNLSSNFAGLNVVLATTDSRINVGFSNLVPLSANCVNLLVGGDRTCGAFLNNGFNNAQGQDRSFMYAFNIASFLSGTTQSFTVYQIFGDANFNLTTALNSLPATTSSGGGVPEPGSLLLMGSALVGLGVFARRRAKN